MTSTAATVFAAAARSTAFLAAGPRRLARGARAQLIAFVARSDARRAGRARCRRRLELGLPVEVGDYVDFYSSLHHATNLGRHLPPGRRAAAAELAAPARRLPRPVGHRRRGRARRSRPSGLVPTGEAAPALQPSARARLRARGRLRRRRRNERGEPIAVDDAGRARLRRRAAQRLVGPRHPGLRVPAARPVPRQELRHDDLAVGRAARRPARRSSSPAPSRSPCPTPLPAHRRDRGRIDLELEVWLHRTATRADRRSVELPDLYWTFAQQLAHLTEQRRHDPAGRPVRVGDRLGPTRGSGQPDRADMARARSLVLDDGSSGLPRRTATPSMLRRAGAATGADRDRLRRGHRRPSCAAGVGVSVPDASATSPASATRCAPRRRTAAPALAEELMGDEGFSGASSLLYHRALAERASLAIEPVSWPSRRRRSTHGEPTTRCSPPPAHRATLAAGADLVTGRRLLLGNDDVTVGVVAAHGDEPAATATPSATSCVYVQAGTASARERRSGARRRPGDYVVVPAGTTHRWVVTGDGPVRAARASRPGATSTSPRRYLSTRRPVPRGRAVLRARPAGPRRAAARRTDDGRRRCSCAPRAGCRRHIHRHHPFDVVGWDGCLYPWALSIHDFEPIVGTHPPAAAGAPDLRGPRLRGVLVRAAASSTSTPTP